MAPRGQGLLTKPPSSWPCWRGALSYLLRWALITYPGSVECCSTLWPRSQRITFVEQIRWESNSFRSISSVILSVFFFHQSGNGQLYGSTAVPRAIPDSACHLWEAAPGPPLRAPAWGFLPESPKWACAFSSSLGFQQPLGWPLSSAGPGSWAF